MAVSHTSPPGRFSGSPIENRMSPHSVDNDCSGWAQQQGGHDDNGGQDDEDNGPDVQDVLGKHHVHRGLAGGVHIGSQIRSRSLAQLGNLVFKAGSQQVY